MTDRSKSNLPPARRQLQRLDALLAERGLFPSRSRAAAAVLAGDVHLGPGRRRAEKPGQLVAADVELDVAAPAAVRLARRHQARERARRARPRRRGAPRARRRRLDRRVHRLPAAARRRARDRARRRVRRAGHDPARRSARDRARAHERARPRSGRAAVPSRPGGRGRVVHLAHEGAARRARVHGRALRRPGDDQAAVRGRARSASARAASCATRSTGARRWSRSPAPPARRAPRCSASLRPGCPGRPGNRETFAWLAEQGGTARCGTSRRRRARWSREPRRHRPHPPALERHRGRRRRAGRIGAPRRRDAAVRRGGDAQARPETAATGSSWTPSCRATSTCAS